MLRNTSPVRRLGIHFLRGEPREPRLDFRELIALDLRDVTRAEFLDPAVDLLDAAALRVPAIFLRTTVESRMDEIHRTIADLSCLERPCCRASSSGVGGSGGGSIILNGRAGMRLLRS